MIPRYEDKRISAIWTYEAKLARWDKVELAVIYARVKQGVVGLTDYERIKKVLADHPCDVQWWLARDKEISHDLNAYIDERRRHIPQELQYLFHQDMTSYDTEEAALALGLLACCDLVSESHASLRATLLDCASQYRYLPFIDNTHGQSAKLATLGGRVLTWLNEIDAAHAAFVVAIAECRWSRLAGAIGNFGGRLTPEIEEDALGQMGLKPAPAPTQILSRVYHAKLAQALQLFAEAIHKIAHDVRLGARSPIPIVHEPFAKKQKGSSAMPHKKNTIRTEQMLGFLRMVRGCVSALVANIQTWERRSIEQSSVERVNWPDLFHMIMHMFKVVDGVLENLAVFPDNMYRIIRDSCGTYATDEAKNFLAELLGKQGADAETAYRIVQLASFCKLTPTGTWKQIRDSIPQTLESAEMAIRVAGALPDDPPESIREFIPKGALFEVEQLDASLPEIARWNGMLKKAFAEPGVMEEWDMQFNISHLLRNEPAIFARFGL